MINRIIRIFFIVGFQTKPAMFNLLRGKKIMPLYRYIKVPLYG